MYSATWRYKFRRAAEALSETGHFQKLHEQSLEFGVVLDLVIVDHGGERLTDGSKTNNQY
jgi:hypothetical protein